MQQVTCAACQTTLPMSEAFSAADRTFCRGCLEQLLSTQQPDQAGVEGIKQMLDPTVCVNCSADNGDVHWEKLADLPACPTCIAFFRNRPYPKWLKISAAVFLCLAVAAFIYNWRFFIGYVEFRRGVRMLDNDRIAEATSLLDRAAHRLPEFPELAVLPNLLVAGQLLGEDKNQEALDRLTQSRPFVPNEMREQYRQAEVAARIGISFNARDYDTLLAATEENAKAMPGEPMAVAAVASALAAKYAETGDESYRMRSLAELERAREMAGDDTISLDEYAARIQHRLATREVIDGKEYRQRFPNGWKPEETAP